MTRHKLPSGVTVSIPQDGGGFLGQVAREGVEHLRRRIHPRRSRSQDLSGIFPRMFPTRETCSHRLAGAWGPGTLGYTDRREHLLLKGFDGNERSGF